MKITKFVHSCLLIESDDDVTMIDPGQFTLESGLLDPASLKRLDHIVITHEHFDHFAEELVQALVARFPEVKIMSTPEVVDKLKAAGIQAQNQGDDSVELFTASHESMAPLMPLPMAQNTGVHYQGRLTHPGDCYHVSASKEIFAMPLAGPWGAAIDGVRLATELKPKVVLPIHDWMWNDIWRSTMYDRLEQYFDGIGIRFIKLKDGQPVEV